MTDLALSKEVAFWKGEIDLYERTTDKWYRRGRKIVKRYKDVRSPREDAVTRLNILWSNVQTRLPALYARDPKPEVERRFKDRDPLGRQVAEILERGLDYTVQHCNAFGQVMRQAILDWELPGRGTVWVRYVPHMRHLEPEQQDSGASIGSPGDTREGTGVTPEVREEGFEETNDQPTEAIGYEETLIDYVYWEDFGHTWARTWEEVRAVWRRVYLTRDEVIARFGKAFNDVPLDWSPKSLNDTTIRLDQKKAIVYEIWDKDSKKVLWVVKNYKDCLDEKEDPLKLTNFFPCPRPLIANATGEELIPVPNFTFYQDQAMEIDELSTRIAAIGKALKVAGIYDSSMPGIDRLLAEGVENQLIPVDGWAVARDKGGLSGAMELLDLKSIAEALGHLREQRQMMIDDVYQVTGLSDIIRGLSDPNETATAQQIKGQFSVLRISDAQTEVQRFCRDTMRIMAEIIAGYDIGTLKEISGVKLLTDAEKAALLAMPPVPAGAMGGPATPPPGAPAAGPAGNQGPPGMGGGMVPGNPAPGPQGAQSNAGGVSPSAAPPKGLNEPSWEDVERLLQQPVLRSFRVDVETDSIIKTDEDADRTARLAFLDTVSKMIGEAASVPKPMIPAVGELILFGIRGFKVARNLERVFEEAIDRLKDMPPPPNPEMIKAQMEQDTALKVAQARAQADIAIETSKQQAQSKDAQFEAQMEQQTEAHKAQLQMQADAADSQAQGAREQAIKEMEQRYEAEKTQYETAAKERIANADNATKLQIEAMRQEHEKHLEGMKQAHEARITSMTQDHEKGLAEHKAKSDKDLAEHKSKTDEKLTDKKGQQSLDLEERKAEKQPENQAVKALQHALEQFSKPRKVVRDEKGQITGIH